MYQVKARLNRFWIRASQDLIRTFLQMASGSRFEAMTPGVRKSTSRHTPGLERGPYSAAYDVSADGKRFLMLKENTIKSEADQLNVVLNWLEELKQRVP